MDDADDSKKIVPAEVLGLEPEAAAALVSGLDEANRFVLVRELVGLARAVWLPPARARTLGAVFGALGRVRLKVHAWSLLTLDRAPHDPHVKAVHAHIAPTIVAVFGVPFGDAGIGVRPTMGTTQEDRDDIQAMRDGVASGWASMYAGMAAKAREAGTLFVEESV